jgi:hypothetical protein
MLDRYRIKNKYVENQFLHHLGKSNLQFRSIIHPLSSFYPKGIHLFAA